MKVAIANAPGGIHDTTEYSILEPLYDTSVALAGTTPKLNTISPYWLEDYLSLVSWYQRRAQAFGCVLIRNSVMVDIEWLVLDTLVVKSMCTDKLNDFSA
jgi:hypothetical protein